MAPGTDNPPLIAIVGETASGKTALAIELAQRFNGEIIAADSRTIYKVLDIGTAKPSTAEQKSIKHHLIDVVDPSTKYSAADFKRQALVAMDTIYTAGKVPFLVGGTGLYIDALLYDFTFRPAPSAADRLDLERLSVEDLQHRIRERGLVMPRNAQNPRHLIRTIETNGLPALKSPLRKNTLILGLTLDREALRTKIEQRVDAMVEAGLVNEVRSAAAQYGWDAPALQAPAYKAFREYVAGIISIEEAKSKFVQNDWLLAKRQRTWFKRNKDIHWICKKEESVDLVTTFLNK